MIVKLLKVWLWDSDGLSSEDKYWPTTLIHKCKSRRICFTEASGVWETKIGHLKTVNGGPLQLIGLLSLLLWVCLQFSIIKVYKTGLTQAFPQGALWRISPRAGEVALYKVRVASLKSSRKPSEILELQWWAMAGVQPGGTASYYCILIFCNSTHSYPSWSPWKALVIKWVCAITIL